MSSFLRVSTTKTAGQVATRARSCDKDRPTRGAMPRVDSRVPGAARFYASRDGARLRRAIGVFSSSDTFLSLLSRKRITGLVKRAFDIMARASDISAVTSRWPL